MANERENSSPNGFSPAELRRIADETFVQYIDFHATLGSTNDRAFELTQETANRFPLLVLAESQTAGRGRGTNQWWTCRGALTFSVLLATEVAELPTERWPQVSLTVGLAVCEALEELLSRGVPHTSLTTLPAVQLKWPNDVYIEDRKICGILVEVPRDCQGKLLLGIGINVNNSLEDAPEGLQATAASFFDLTGRPLALADVLIEVLKKLAARLSPVGLWSETVRNGWLRRCYLTGKQIEIDLGTRRSTGVCRGIDESGALLLEVDDRIEKHLAGVITVLQHEER